jgi:cytochrome c peroxidase
MPRWLALSMVSLWLGCPSASESGSESGSVDPESALAPTSHVVALGETQPAPAERPSPPGVPSAIEPLPRHVRVDPARAALGERLFTDARLSGDQRVSCADCHVLSLGGANGESHTSLPEREEPVPVNVPTIFNLAFDFRYGWDGRYKTLEQVLDFAIASKATMDSSFVDAAARLKRDAPLANDFASAYPQGLNEVSLRDALAAYCRSAITPNARFDRFLRRELSLEPDELRGYEAFRDYGCVSCHQGVNVGGNMLQRLGVMLPYFTDARPAAPTDLGRYNLTRDERDRYVFRVPSLRNVARTAPYLHDGSAATLEQAVAVMARYQLGRDLPAETSQQLVAFLRTLTGEYHGKPL